MLLFIQTFHTKILLPLRMLITREAFKKSIHFFTHTKSDHAHTRLPISWKSNVAFDHTNHYSRLTWITDSWGGLIKGLLPVITVGIWPLRMTTFCKFLGWGSGALTTVNWGWFIPKVCCGLIVQEVDICGGRFTAGAEYNVIVFSLGGLFNTVSTWARLFILSSWIKKS